MIYTIKSELVGGMHMPEQEVIRTIRIGGSASLDDLCEVMLRSLDSVWIIMHTHEMLLFPALTGEARHQQRKSFTSSV